MKNNRSGFTLIELLIVIGIIAILAAAIIIAINPGQQFAQARDATRQGHINSLNNAILSYMVSNYGDLSGLNLPSTPTEICANTSTCDGLVNLEPLLTGGHLSAIPIDPSGGILTNGSGYYISQSSNTPSISSYNNETRNIGLGPCPPTIKDLRDGNVYKTVQIGSQCWMAENLAYDNGCTEVVWENGIDKGWCGLPQSPHLCTLGVDCTPEEGHGLLYQWSAAMNNSTTEGVQGICPAGWHLPTDAEQHTLDNYFATGTCNASRNDYDCAPAGIALKSGGSSGWNGLLSGYRNCSDGIFRDFGSDGRWWSSTSQASGNAWSRNLDVSYSTVNRGTNNQGHGFLVRCLRD